MRPKECGLRALSIGGGTTVEFRALALRRGADALRQKSFKCDCSGCCHMVLVAQPMKAGGRRRYGIMTLWQPER